MTFSPNLLKFSMSKFGEPQRPCHYTCIVTPPLGMLAGGALGGVGAFLSVVGSAQVSLMAHQVTLPASNLTTTPFTMYGITHKMPYGRIYDDISISFICSKSMAERHFFDVWLQFIHNPFNNFMHYYKDYTGTIIVKPRSDLSGPPLAEVGNALSGFVLQETYPVSISAQEFAYENAESYLSLNVIFAYRKQITFVEGIQGILASG